MNKPFPSTGKVRGQKETPHKRVQKPKAKKKPEPQSKPDLRLSLSLITLEVIALGALSIYASILMLGAIAEGFSGTSLLGSLMPFLAGILGFSLAIAFLLAAWWRFRRLLNRHSMILAPSLAVAIVLFTAVTADFERFHQAFARFRTLVGGKQEAARITLNHQVFAAYRRYSQDNLHKMIARSQPFTPAIDTAAETFGLDRDLMLGIAATESSFVPRESRDGGHGLFQITAVPKQILAKAKQQLGVDRLNVEDPKHNAFIAAATFKHYLAEMKNDVFLGLLAYNIGPANGGLRFIMKTYGATDFITIQPYLQLLPRDYPIRVLSYALAFRLWQKEGKLPAYEEGSNALRIQRMGIPGLP